MTSISTNILNSFNTEFVPDHENGRSHDETVALWAILCFASYIDDVGWIDHTSDWDLAFEITTKKGITYIVTDVVPLMENPEKPFTKDSGVNKLINSLMFSGEDVVSAINEDKSDRTEYDDIPTMTINLSDIERLVYT